MNCDFDRKDLKRLLEKFRAVVKRQINKSLANKLRQDSQDSFRVLAAFGNRPCL